MNRVRPFRVLLFAGALALVPGLMACESTTAPKFPKPVEEPEDSTPEEGMTRRWSMTVPSAGTMGTGVMPFTFPTEST